MRSVQTAGMGGAGRGDEVRVFDRELALAGLCGPPERVIDDAQLGDLGRDPLVARIDVRDPLTGCRVLDVAQPVPDQFADIELVVYEPGAARRMTAQGGVGPQGDMGAGNGFVVQAPGDRSRADAGGEVTKDAADNLGFGLVDSALASDRFAVGMIYFTTS